MHKLVKRSIAALVCAAVTVTAAYQGAVYMKNHNQVTADVVSVASIADSYYYSSSTIDGNIASNVTQEIKVDKDVVIDRILVEQGQSVRTGDVLAVFDTTLVQMELSIAKLKHQKLEQDLNTARNRLTSLQNGGSVQESDTAGVNADQISFSGTSALLVMPGYITASVLSQNPMIFYMAEIIEEWDEVYDDSGEVIDDMDNIYDDWDDDYDDYYDGDDGWEDDSWEDDSSTDISFDDLLDSGSDSSGNNTVIGSDEISFLDPENMLDSGEAEEEDLTMKEQIFYDVLTYDSVAFTGTGTEEDPFVFLCSQTNGNIILKGSFFNRMAGYGPDGSVKLSESGYHFRLEFHQDDTVTDPSNRNLSLVAYYEIDGGLLESTVRMDAEVELTVADAIPYEYTEVPSDDNGSYYDGGVDNSSVSLSRSEVIKILEMRISSLSLDLQESELNISKLEKKAAVTQVSSRLEGVISYLGDVNGGTSINETFMRVQSEDGYYVRGSISELMLDDITVGTLLNCNGYESGSFTAEIIDIADYPSTSNMYYYGDTNPNVSYYEFTAALTEENANLSSSDWITITVQNQEEGEGGIVLSKALVRSENGVSYVYIDRDGVLKKQIIKVKEIVNSGYSVLIGSGLSTEDLIAFPYSSSAAEGVKTKEVSVSDFYGYS